MGCESLSLLAVAEFTVVCAILQASQEPRRHELYHSATQLSLKSQRAAVQRVLSRVPEHLPSVKRSCEEFPSQRLRATPEV